jgi:hypothetical protein
MECDSENGCPTLAGSVLMNLVLNYVTLKIVSFKYGDVTIADERLQSLGICSALKAFE